MCLRPVPAGQLPGQQRLRRPRPGDDIFQAGELRHQIGARLRPHRLIEDAGQSCRRPPDRLVHPPIIEHRYDINAAKMIYVPRKS